MREPIGGPSRSVFHFVALPLDGVLVAAGQAPRRAGPRPAGSRPGSSGPGRRRRDGVVSASITSSSVCSIVGEVGERLGPDVAW